MNTVAVIVVFKLRPRNVSAFYVTRYTSVFVGVCFYYSSARLAAKRAVFVVGVFQSVAVCRLRFQSVAFVVYDLTFVLVSPSYVVLYVSLKNKPLLS